MKSMTPMSQAPLGLGGTELTKIPAHMERVWSQAQQTQKIRSVADGDTC